jgi:sec-independent protein translocase protein TatA
MCLAIIPGVSMPGWMEGLLILLAIMLLFGAKRLPDLARSLGKSVNEFKKGREEGAAPAKAEKDADELPGGSAKS